MSEKKRKERIEGDLLGKLVDKGRLIETGFDLLAEYAFPEAEQDQITDMRFAYMAGAAHLFSSILAILDPGKRTTKVDLSRMTKIHEELGKWENLIQSKINPLFTNSERVNKVSEEKLGDGPIEEQYRKRMSELASFLDMEFNGNDKGNDRQIGFVLLVFKFGEGPGRTNFISNGADRRDIVTLFREMIARFEGQPEMEGHA